MNPMSSLTALLALAFLASSLEASPLRLRHSSKRVTTTDPSEHRGSRLVDREGKPLPKSFWHNENPTGTPRIEVDLSKQVAHVYFDDVLIGQSPISSGRPGHATPTGEFTIIGKNEKHASNLYGSWVGPDGKFAGEADAGDVHPRGYRYVAAPMPYFLRITYSGVGFHAGYIPGFPASHGCIRLPREMAATFFKHLPKGTKVVILDSGQSAENSGQS